MTGDTKVDAKRLGLALTAIRFWLVLAWHRTRTAREYAILFSCGVLCMQGIGLTVRVLLGPQ